MKIFVRADGGKNIGLGHIMRMLVLGKELKKNNQIIFICKNNQNGIFKAGIEKIKENNFDIIEVSEENFIEDIIKIGIEFNQDNMLITDSYDVNEEYFIKLRPYFKLHGYVDDVNRFKMTADFIINQNIDAMNMDYSKTTNSETKLFLGTQYCMIREEFRETSNEKIIKDKVEDVLVTLGGMDNNYNTKKVLDLIKDCKKNIHVILGSAFDEELIKIICDLSKEYNNIHAYRNANMAELMKKSDIAIAACGSTLYELCAMQVPAIGVIVADNQENVANVMKQKGLVLDIFNTKDLDSNKLICAFNQLINDKSIKDEIIKNQKNIINITGVCDLANEIENLILHHILR